MIRYRFEYRKMLETGPDGMREVNVVYDTWHDKVRARLDSKYQCKQYIKRHQEEAEVEDGQAE